MNQGAAPPVPVEETYTPTSTANELPPAMQLASAIEPSPVSKGKRSAKQEAEAQRLNALIETAALTHGVDPRYVRALIGIESGGNPTAVSNKGALGAMQLMPATAKAMGVTDAMDLEQNIMGGVKYYKQMLDTFDGDPELAAAAYNAGPTAVRKHGGVPPFAETKNYVAKFKRILGR
jgi:soluble lytic murein transglycosylase-like protein